MQFQQSSYGINLIISRISSGKLALPDFQRDFVWNPNQVVELLDSVSKQWPIGSLLLLTGPQNLAFRPIADGPKISSDHISFYLLDGQQRVTALYHAIANVSEYCYYVNFKEFDDSYEGMINWERRSIFEKKYPTIRERSSSSIALIKDIWSPMDFYDWLSFQKDSDTKLEYTKLREVRLKGLNEGVYNIFAIVLEQSIGLEAFARIFETLNRTGVALNAFDLMVAALYPGGFNLRDEFEKAKFRYTILEDYDVDEIEILRFVSVITRIREGKGSSYGVRQGDLLKLKHDFIKKYWDSAVIGYVETLEYISSDLGITTPDLVPSWPMVICVAAMLYMDTPQDEIIQKWWKLRLLDQYFSQAANTKIISEIDMLRASPNYALFLEGNESRGKIGAEEVNDEDFWLRFIKRSAKGNGASMKGVAGLIVKSGATDPYTGEELRHADQVSFRALDLDLGIVRKIGQNDSIDCFIVVSKGTDKMIGKEKPIEFFVHGAESFLSQGLSPNSLRNPSYIEAIFNNVDGYIG